MLIENFLNAIDKAENLSMQIIKMICPTAEVEPQTFDIDDAYITFDYTVKSVIEGEVSKRYFSFVFDTPNSRDEDETELKLCKMLTE